MATRVIMPTLGLTMEQGTIVRWLKREGEAVERDEPLFTVETDKATMDVPAPASGVLARVLAPEGAVVPVQQTIAIIAAPGEAVPAELAAAEPGAPASPPPAAASAGAPAAPTAGPVAGAPAPEAATGRAAPASPRARRVARELGVDLTQVQGTGPGGRIVEADVRRHAAGQRAAPAARATPLAQRLALELGVDLSAVAGTGPGGRITRQDVEAAAARGAVAVPTAPPPIPPAAAPAAAVPAAARGGRLAALSRLRRITAERMAHSARTVARVTLFTEVDFAEAVRFRAQLLAEFERRYGARLTYDALIARACALALLDHPALNAHWTDEGPRLYDQVDIGVAVALPDGLVVPVIRDAARRPLWDLARTLDELVARAREGRLGPDDFGGTFTITNLGMYGVEGFTPIVNPPEVAILGVGAIQRKPVVVNDTVAVRERVTLSLAFDHRAVDGAPAAAFLARVREVLEKPYILLT
ncbi:MAG TPA: dihydrolipoamide acetyltransferase family protein [Chloroflexota bacterium]|nr:dihydrolipoamide acetyltransferase family protein [Chloroflexota bacterium]